MDAEQPVKQQERGRSKSRDRSDVKGGNNKGSMGRKIATEAIASSKQGVMGASVYIAENIKVKINFNF